MAKFKLLLIINVRWPKKRTVICYLLFMRRLTIGKVLGEGAFGLVMKAEAVNIGDKRGTVTVAVKMLKG